jgi:cytoskeleton protein RodZ
MNASDHNADLFPHNNDASSENSFGEMRFHADDVTDGGPAADAASDMGARLKAAREARGMDLQSCGQALRLPVRVLARLEAGDFGKADDHVFTRGALQSYARLLDVPGFAVEAALRVTAPPQQPVLIPTGNALRGNWLQRYGAAATYIVLTAFVAVPLVWLGLRGGLDNQLTRIAPLDHAPAANARVAQTIKAPAKSGQERPLMASMTPFPAMNLEAATTTQAPASQPVKPPAAPAVAHGTDHVLTLDAHGDSWIEVTDAGGRTLESGMLHAGDTRSYHSSSALSVTLGNADAVAVQSDGKPLSLDAYRRANVARFKVFASGSGNG